MTHFYQTQDRQTIIAWIERRSAHAAQVVGSHPDADPDFEPSVGALRVGFPGYASNETLEPLSWDAFFERFDERGAVFHYQETDENGNPSNAYQILPD